MNPAVLPEKCRILHDACAAAGGGAWPVPRAAFGPEPVKDILPHLFIVRHGPDGRAAFTLFGTMLCQHFGRDLTRREPDGCAEFAGLQGGFAALWDRTAPLYRRDVVLAMHGGPLRADVLTAPLSRAGGAADEVVGVMDVQESPFLLHARRHLPRAFWALCIGAAGAGPFLSHRIVA